MDLDALRRIVATGTVSLPLTVTDAMLRTGLSERWMEDVERVLGQLPGILARLEHAKRVEAAAREVELTYVDWLNSADADNVWETTEFAAFAVARLDLRAALANAPVEASKP
jgi:hypothetical protein